MDSYAQFINTVGQYIHINIETTCPLDTATKESLTGLFRKQSPTIYACYARHQQGHRDEYNI